MNRSMVGVAALAVVAAGLSGVTAGASASSASYGACPRPLPQGSEEVTLDPADFVDRIDNPYWPMAPGSVWVTRESDIKGNAAKVRVEVLDRTKSIVGIDATVVHDTLSEGRELVENTFDWYAQDVCGNTWYLGENTREYENGQVVSREGSWEHGVDGAQAGIAVPADPQVGLTYRQEYYAGHAEDAGEVLSLDEQVKVPYGHFRNVLLTKDTTTLEPRVLEYKFYAKGVGPILAIGISGGSDREELLRYHAP
jgi:hypothetical protein